MKMISEISRDKIVVAEVARLREFRCVAEVAETVAEVAETSAPMLGIFNPNVAEFAKIRVGYKSLITFSRREFS